MRARLCALVSRSGRRPRRFHQTVTALMIARVITPHSVLHQPALKKRAYSAGHSSVSTA